MVFDTEMFIVEIKNRPSIWDCTSNDYANRKVKKKNWEEIVETFGGSELDIGEKKELGYSLQKKWKGLRTCYAREIKRRKTTKFGSRNDRKSEYVYFKQLQFLQKVTVNRETLECDEQGDQEDIEGMEKSVDGSIKKLRLSPIENENYPCILTSQKSIDTRQPQQEEESDEDRMFLLSLLRALKSVPDEIKLATKIKLMSVLNEATKHNYHDTKFRPNNEENYSSGYSTQHASQPTYQRLSTSHSKIAQRSECRNSKPQYDPLMGTNIENMKYCEEQAAKPSKNSKDPRRHR